MIEKYVCINNTGIYRDFVIGKIYDVKKTDYGISLYQDYLLPLSIPNYRVNKLFIPLSEWRNHQIDKILNGEDLN